MPTDVAFTSGKSAPQASCKCKLKRKKAVASGTAAVAIEKVSTKFAESILQSMVATVKRGEGDAIRAFCTELITDQYSTIKKDISYLCSSILVIEARMDQLVDDMHCIRSQVLEKSSVKRAEQSLQVLKTENHFKEKSNIDVASNPRVMNNVPSNIDKLIAGLVADMTSQSKEMAVWKDLFQKM